MFTILISSSKEDKGTLSIDWNALLTVIQLLIMYAKFLRGLRCLEHFLQWTSPCQVVVIPITGVDKGCKKLVVENKFIISKNVK